MPVSYTHLDVYKRQAVDRGLTAYGINSVVQSLIIDGIFNGVGNVLSFLPIIVVLFFFLSMLEDTGSVSYTHLIDALICCGKNAEFIYKGLISTGLETPAWHFPMKEALLRTLPSLIRQNDPVLVLSLIHI